MYHKSRGSSTSRGYRRDQKRSFRPKRNNNSLDIFLLKNPAIEQKQEAYVAKHAFSDFAIHDQLQQNIIERGYETPTPIQDQAIPELLSGKDVIGIANTGTGKTAAFLIPLINKVFSNRSEKVLIVAPTRELAVQIEEEFRIFAKGMQLFSALCIGGMSMHHQIQSLRKKPDFVIGTPGRLKDLEKQGKIQFMLYNNIVLDEVDRMLDMGFIHDVNYIIHKLPQKRHSLFFSATFPSNIQEITTSLLRNPVTISVKPQETLTNIHQDVIKTNGRMKIDLLHDLLIQVEFQKVLVFGRTKWGIEKLSRMLMERGFKVASIHGNKRQNQRVRALEDFKNNRIQILLATDIASRGLDIDNVTHVINYDQPASYEDYVHRIGRTGRANKRGTALTFID
ncbi:MAG: DEAD/DEAH box helicase [Candidatus Levybacteria bacterium]|nr:DEAD/DEAH box helicase [Candidatus Levybacteria bacterium]